MLQGGQLRAGRETLHFSRNNGSRVGMLEVNYVFVPGGVSTFLVAPYYEPTKFPHVLMNTQAPDWRLWYCLEALQNR